MRALRVLPSAAVRARLSDAVVDRARGCILGSLLGDAIGAPLEFSDDLSPDAVQVSLNLKGGGVLKVAPGQITDDGELAMRVLHGLTKCREKYNPDIICVEYGRWMQSRPFDIGHTTRYCLGHAAGPQEGLSERVSKAALKMIHSVSNGSTMKLSPTAVYGAFLPLETMLQVVETETQHMHHHQNVIDCNIAFASAIRSLIHGGNPNEVYEAHADQVLKSSIASWFTELEQGNLHPVPEKMGWVKIAYQQAFLHLKKNTKYEDALRAVISQGGDTDTNACIVGMLLGARDGESQLDPAKVDKLLSCNTQLGHPRPVFLQTNKGIYALIDTMLKNALVYADDLSKPVTKTAA